MDGQLCSRNGCIQESGSDAFLCAGDEWNTLENMGLFKSPRSRVFPAGSKANGRSYQGHRQDLAFFGHIIRSDGFHRNRSDTLAAVAKAGRRIRIYTPQLVAGTTDPFRLGLRTAKSLALYPAKICVYGITRSLVAMGMPKQALVKNRFSRRALELDGSPRPLPGAKRPSSRASSTFPTRGFWARYVQGNCTITYRAQRARRLQSPLCIEHEALRGDGSRKPSAHGLV